MSDISDLSKAIAACIEAKQGNREFALFYFDDGWRAEIGNGIHIILGEACAELSFDHANAIDAVNGLLMKIRDDNKRNR